MGKQRKTVSIQINITGEKGELINRFEVSDILLADTASVTIPLNSYEVPTPKFKFRFRP